MGKVIDLDEQFSTYFHELETYAMRSERFYSDVNANIPALDKSLLMLKWLQAAFNQGARVMAQDTLDTLDDYGTAVAGIDEVVYNRSQAFDAARANLFPYFTQVLSKAEDK